MRLKTVNSKFYELMTWQVLISRQLVMLNTAKEEEHQTRSNGFNFSAYTQESLSVVKGQISRKVKQAKRVWILYS